MQHKPLRRLLSGILAAAVAVNGLIIPTLADDGGSSVSFKKVSNDKVSAGLPLKNVVTETKETPLYADTDEVRVSIVLKDKSTLEAGFEAKDIAENDEAMRYRAELQEKQDAVVTEIERVTKKSLDVVWNLTLAANIISANVKYGEIEKIEKLREVKEVLIETQYEPAVLKQPIATDPNMATSSEQIGSSSAWAAGYTGAGSRLAIIDTGADNKHLSFNADAFMYSLNKLAEDSEDPDGYIGSLHLLDKAELDTVKDQLHIKIPEGNTYLDTYLNAKIPFAYNYVDKNLNTDHENDTQGEHGSHVAGISTANKYIKNEDGTYSKALDDGGVLVQGVAPDAQLLVMKVFGKAGGAYDSDYMIAIEDAIILKADSVNLSLGSSNPGLARSSNKTYQDILDGLTEKGVVVSISAGNEGMWADETTFGELYLGDVATQTDGSPGSFTNALTVASVDNCGFTGNCFEVGGNKIFYTETSYTNKEFTTLAGEQEYVFIDGFGTEEDWAAVGDALKGKIAVCSRGGISFYVKGENAVAAGAIGVIIYNNQAGTISMDLSDYTGTAPFVSITQAEGALLKQLAEPVEAKAEEEALPEGENEDEAAPEATEEEAEENTEADENAPEADEDETAPAETEAAPAEGTQADVAAEDGQADEPAYYLGSITVSKSVMTSGDISNGQYTMSSFSGWGVPGTLQLKPEITAPGGNIYSVFGYNKTASGFAGGHDKYENMSGTSMAAPQITGMAAVLAQYIRENKLEEKTGLNERVLIQSLLMSTAVPITDEDGAYYPVMNQGAGLANVNAAINADSYILMDENATISAADGKVKVELGDDPDYEGSYSFSFTINNLTDETKTYTLSADMFTQDWYGARLSATLVDYFLDRATIELENTATFSGDEVSGNKVTVAPGASAEVNVSIVLSDDEIDQIQYWYETGAFIEGYVYAESDTDSEGVEGTVHSIPVLGFLGNWTDPSMFDSGSPLEFLDGTYPHVYPYFTEYYNDYYGDPSYLNPIYALLLENSFTIKYIQNGGETVTFWGNPCELDEDDNDKYYPERNAINGNDRIERVTFSSIRNAADSRFVVTGDADDYEQAFGTVYSAYYYASAGGWKGVQQGISPRFVPADSGYSEGDVLTASFELAPEYYVDYTYNEETETYDKTTDWDALGVGASKSLTLTVDNTPPEVADVEIDEENGVFKVTASDNRYIAAVALYNSNGTVMYDIDGPKDVIEMGEEAVYELSFDGVPYNKEFYIQVYDYAMNTTTWEIEDTALGELDLPKMAAFNTDLNHWVELNEDSEAADMKEEYAPADYTFAAATIMDHMVFAAADNGNMYVMPEYDLTNTKLVGSTVVYGTGGIVVTPTDMAYSEGSPYGDAIFAVGTVGKNSFLFQVDISTGMLDLIDLLPFQTMTLACDKNGYFYSSELGTTNVYKYELAVGTDVDEETGEEYAYAYVDSDNLQLITKAEIPEVGDYGQAMEIDPDDDTKLYWISVDNKTSYFVTLDLTRYDFNDDKITDYDDGQALLDYRTGVRKEIAHVENADFDGADPIDTYDAYLYFKLMNGETHNDLKYEMTSLIIFAEHEGNDCTTGIPFDADPIAVLLSDEEISMFEDTTYQLEATVQPWNVKDDSVMWLTYEDLFGEENEIASVDQNGVVTAIGEGTTLVIAVSNQALEQLGLEEALDIAGLCLVNVEKLDITISGALQDEDGKPLIYEWNVAESDRWSKISDLQAPVRNLTSAAQAPDGNMLIMDGTNYDLHKVDPATGESLEDYDNTLTFSDGSPVPYWDMEYSQVFKDGTDPMVAGIYGPYLFVPQNPAKLKFSYFNYGSSLANYTGANYFVAITSMGAFRTTDSSGNAVTSELYVLLDDLGCFWFIAAYPTATGSWSAKIVGLYGSDLDEEFAGYETSDTFDMFCSMIVGDDDRLYLSIFNGDTNNIYCVDYDLSVDTWSAILVGDVGDTVWPAAIVSAEMNNPAAAGASNASAASFDSAMFFSAAPAEETVEVDLGTDSTFVAPERRPIDTELTAETLSIEAFTANEEPANEEIFASVESLFRASDDESVVSVDKEISIKFNTATFKMDIVAHDNEMNEVDSTHGLIVVNFDPEALELVSAVPTEAAEYNSVNLEAAAQGTVILGYVNPSEPVPAGEAIDTLTFKVLDSEKADETVIKVGTAEIGNGEEDDHTNNLADIDSPLDATDPDTVTDTLDKLPTENNTVKVADDGSGEGGGNGGGIGGGNSGDNSGDPDVTTSAEGTTEPSGNVTETETTTASEDNTGTQAPEETGTAAPDTTKAPDASNTDDVNNTGSGNAPEDEDKNVYTGVVLFIAPAAASAIAVVLSKKRRK